MDLLARREPFYTDAAQLFSLADKKMVELSISCLSIANTSTKEILRKLCLIVHILPLDHKIIGLALNDDSFTDFEYALQYFTALENDQELIITRNLKDFRKSNLPVFKAKQYLKMEKQKPTTIHII